MAKRVLRYNEEEFITLLENIVKKVKAEEQRINESKKRTSPARRLNESNRNRSVNNRPTPYERFKKLK
jgi:hypothetical protein